MANKFSVLIIEDENNIANFISTILSANSFTVYRAANGAESMMMVTSRCPDVIILDLGLPDMDGMRIIKYVREWSHTPIIVVSARSRERDKVMALDAGADDYMTKPFGTSELLARVRCALRHGLSRDADGQVAQTGIFSVGGLKLDFNKRRITVDGAEVKLTATEYNIVALLSKYAGRVLTHDYIIKNIWGPNATDDNQILRVNMANIRRKIEKNPAEPEYIFTEMGVGYRMAEDDSRHV